MLLPSFQPMKGISAKQDDEAWYSEDFIAEEKLDGVRQLFCKDDRGIRFLSPRVSVQTGRLVQNQAQVPHLVKQLSFLPNGTILDGEIVDLVHRRSKYVVHLLKCLPEKSIARQKEEGRLCYVVFDLLYYKGKNLRNKKLRYRKQLLKKALESSKHDDVWIVRSSKSKKYMRVVEGKKVQNKEKFYYDITTHQNGEGIMLKNLNSVYRTNKGFGRPVRSSDWRKVKKSETFDVVIMGFTQPDKTSVNVKGEVVTNRNYANGWISGIVFGQYVRWKDFDPKKALQIVKGYRHGHDTYAAFMEYARKNSIRYEGKSWWLQPFGVTTGMNDYVRELLSKAPQKHVGKVIEIEAERREKESDYFHHPRFKCFRDDKVPEFAIFDRNES